MLISGNRNAPILIIADAPTAVDVERGRAFSSAAGYEIVKILGEAGISPSSCRFTYVCQQPPPGGNFDNLFFNSKSPCKDEYTNHWGERVWNPVISGLQALAENIADQRPRMIIALGDLALWALYGESSVAKWRGSMLVSGAGPVSVETPTRFIPTYTASTIFQQWNKRNVLVSDIRRAGKWTNAEWWPVPDYDFSTSPSADECINRINEIRAAKRPFACDIETTNKQINLVGLANSKTSALVIPLMTRETADFCYFSRDDEQRVVEALRGLLEDPECGIIGQNFHYDAQFFLRQLGIYPHVKHDTMWMHHVCFPGVDKSLDYLASIFCQWYVYWKDDLKDYKRLPDDEQKFRRYNCQDVVYTYEVWENLTRLIEQMRLTEQYKFQMSIFDPLLHMMTVGIRVDFSKRAALREKLGARQKELETLLREVVGERVGASPKAAEWFRSTDQIKKLFYEEMQLPVIKDRKTGRPTVNDEALIKIGNSHHHLWPLCQWLKEYASLDTFISTFLDAQPDVDGRMRCFFKGAGAESFRLASAANSFGSGLNMQNIPRQSGDINVRAMFTPDPGYVILDFDLSSADLRVVIAEADAKKLQGVLDRKEDVYGTLASKMDGSAYVGKKHPKRQVMKNVAHALDYVGGEKTISETYGLPRDQVAATKQWYFRENPEIPQWHRKVESGLRTTRRVENRYGFRRTFFERIESCLAAATAWVGQSTVAITINKGLMNIWNNLTWVQILLQVHDSLVVQIPVERFTPENVALIQRNLLIPIPYSGRAPLIIPVECKASNKSWGEATDLPLLSVEECLANVTSLTG